MRTQKYTLPALLYLAQVKCTGMASCPTSGRSKYATRQYLCAWNWNRVSFKVLDVGLSLEEGGHSDVLSTSCHVTLSADQGAPLVGASRTEEPRQNPQSPRRVALLRGCLRDSCVLSHAALTTALLSRRYRSNFGCRGVHVSACGQETDESDDLIRCI